MDENPNFGKGASPNRLAADRERGGGIDLDWAFPAGRFRLVPGLRLSAYAPLERIGAERAFGRLVVYRRLDRGVLNLVPAGWYVGLGAHSG